MSIFIDLGGSKTLIKFQNKDQLENFLSNFNKNELKIDKKNYYIEILTHHIKTERNFFNFLDLLSKIDNLFLIFPEPLHKRKFYSKKFDFLNGKSIDDLEKYRVLEVLQDIKALTFYFGDNFFKKNENQNKKMTTIILGTGINYLSLDFFEFKNLLFLDKIYESGHSVFEYNGKVCHCGREGCVERYLGGKYLTQEFKLEDLSSLSHISSKKLEFHKRIAYFLSSILISHGTDNFFIYGGLTHIIDKDVLIDFVKGTLPFNMDIEFEIELNNDPLAQIKGFEIYLENKDIKKKSKKKTQNKKDKNKKNQRANQK
ncbi:MAG TPA: ROK family protein [Nautiliaceae bacterium]|nr:ROK family protein [Nautiliaceae bacterium]